MDYIKINKLLKTSIYKQIAQSIADAINDGILQYNDKLPTEKEICQIFSISQTAVKMAYEKLIAEGKIKRIKGKGTYVTNRETLHDDLRGFYRNDMASGGYQKDLIMIDSISRDYSAYRAMRLENDELTYLVISVTKNHRNPMYLQKIYLPKKFYPNFEKTYSVQMPLLRFIEDASGYKIKHIHSTYSPINATSAEALLLKINADDAIYFIRSKIVDVNDDIIAYVCHYYPGEFTEFEVTVNAI